MVAWNEQFTEAKEASVAALPDSYDGMRDSRTFGMGWPFLTVLESLKKENDIL